MKLQWETILCFSYGDEGQDLRRGGKNSTTPIRGAPGAWQARGGPARLKPGQQLMNPAPTMTYETVDPITSRVEQFDGFGPMGTGVFRRLVANERSVPR